jgi:hypothetical protein
MKEIKILDAVILSMNHKGDLQLRTSSSEGLIEYDNVQIYDSQNFLRTEGTIVEIKDSVNDSGIMIIKIAISETMPFTSVSDIIGGAVERVINPNKMDEDLIDNVIGPNDTRVDFLKKKAILDISVNHYDLIDKTLADMRELLTVKAKEYVRNEDVFHNFKMAALMSRNKVDALGALRGMKMKHDVSLEDLFDDYSAGVEISNDKLREKILDEIIYNLLAYSLIINKV